MKTFEIRKINETSAEVAIHLLQLAKEEIKDARDIGWGVITAIERGLEDEPGEAERMRHAFEGAADWEIGLVVAGAIERARDILASTGKLPVVKVRVRLPDYKAVAVWP